MEKLMQERFEKEPEMLALAETIQHIALKKLFAIDAKERANAEKEWEEKRYDSKAAVLFSGPDLVNSLNHLWYEKANSYITSYKVRPVRIKDEDVQNRLKEHLDQLAKDAKDPLLTARAIMAERIFSYHFSYDILCIQEGDYLQEEQFPKNYELRFTKTAHSKNGIAWNKEKLEICEVLGNLGSRGFAIKLREKETGKTIAVATGHLTGCNPNFVQIDPITGIKDSQRGDEELLEILNVLEESGADVLIIGLDSNVTALHPRLSIIKEAGFQIDAEHFIESTCTSPYLLLNTRIDWIAVKTKDPHTPIITNIPVKSIGLNSMLTNISDHKPIAAKIRLE